MDFKEENITLGGMPLPPSQTVTPQNCHAHCKARLWENACSISEVLNNSDELSDCSIPIFNAEPISHSQMYLCL